MRGNRRGNDGVFGGRGEAARGAPRQKRRLATIVGTERLGWIVGPAAVLPDLSVVHIYNSIVPGGIAQAAALGAPAPGLDVGGDPNPDARGR